MQTKGLEYFLNAVLYCIWKQKMQFGRFLHKISTKCMEFVMKYLSSAKMRERMKRNSLNYEKDYDRLFYHNKYGFHIVGAKNLLASICFLYIIALPAAFIGLSMKYFPDYREPIIFCLILIFVPQYFRYMNKLILDNDNYINYFKVFERSDKQWHRKWNVISFSFFVGGFTCWIIAISITVAIALS